MTTKTELIEEIKEYLPNLEAFELIEIFQMIFGHGEENINTVDWKN